MTAYRIYRRWNEASPAQKAGAIALIILAKVQSAGTRQVRLYRGMIRTYPFPAKGGYGTRGMLIGIYSATVRPEWIEEDILQFLSGEAS